MNYLTKPLGLEESISAAGPEQPLLVSGRAKLVFDLAYLNTNLVGKNKPVIANSMKAINSDVLLKDLYIKYTSYELKTWVVDTYDPTYVFIFSKPVKACCIRAQKYGGSPYQLLWTTNMYHPIASIPFNKFLFMSIRGNNFYFVGIGEMFWSIYIELLGFN